MDWRQRAEPPAPWRLKGGALVRLQPVAAGALDPPGRDLKTVRVAPGRTLGGLYAAAYGEGSTLRYHELIIFSALVRKGPRLGFRVSHAWVDNPLSAAGGLEIWGLPKRLAGFRWTEDDGRRNIVVEEDGGMLCRIGLPAPRHSLRLPLAAPVWSRKGARLFLFRATGSAQVSLVRGGVRVPASSPFAELGLRDGWIFELDGLDVEVPAD